jgi:hypothetical protein
MAHPIGLLLPWLVFAIAVGLKTWKVSRLINRQVRSSPWEMKAASWTGACGAPHHPLKRGSRRRG